MQTDYNQICDEVNGDAYQRKCLLSGFYMDMRHLKWLVRMGPEQAFGKSKVHASSHCMHCVLSVVLNLRLSWVIPETWALTGSGVFWLISLICLPSYFQTVAAESKQFHPLLSVFFLSHLSYVSYVSRQVKCSIFTASAFSWTVLFVVAGLLFFLSFSCVRAAPRNNTLATKWNLKVLSLQKEISKSSVHWVLSY